MLFSGDVLRVCKCDGVPQMYLYIGLSATSLEMISTAQLGSQINPVKCHRTCVIHYYLDPLGLILYVQIMQNHKLWKNRNTKVSKSVCKSDLRCEMLKC